MSSASSVDEQLKVLPGKCFPLGATCMTEGVNFCVFSKHATSVELVLFPVSAREKIRFVKLDPLQNRTYNYWHIFVAGLTDGQEYGFRVDGPFEPERGLRFDSQKLLLDPYTRAVQGWQTYDRQAACRPGENLETALRSVVIRAPEYDWEGDTPLRIPYAHSVIYEMHVGGFTRHESSAVPAEKRGTFAGVIEKIPYLKELGVTAVELMPVQEFDPVGASSNLSNYWGYSTLAFFAPHHGYCLRGDAREGINEFRDMVKALHKAGIEVILDVVFNHTSEGNENGPTQSFRGLDNFIYYELEPGNEVQYANYSGCGNSFNANHPVVGRLILDSLRYWASEMHVDGFRFDLAAALARDMFGKPLSLPPLLWTIESDPYLAGTKLIAEAWDAAGLYRVGWFVNAGQWYAEWNGPFRDDMRRFVKGDTDTISRLAARLTGSGDLYIKQNREPNRSINFITCHDGFTLHDLVAYNQKHNEGNGEGNRDGANDNYSWNCGTEGSTQDRAVLNLRRQQMKNLLTLLFVSQGTPMMLMGDEAGRTQKGNNNAYCHDDRLTWFDWTLLETNRDLFRFAQHLIAFTQNLRVFSLNKVIRRLDAGCDPENEPFIEFHGVKLNQPDWSTASHAFAFSLHHRSACEHVHVMLNSFWQELEFQLPPTADGRVWRRIVDTSLASPADIATAATAEAYLSAMYTVSARSAVILIS